MSVLVHNPLELVRVIAVMTVVSGAVVRLHHCTVTARCIDADRCLLSMDLFAT